MKIIIQGLGRMGMQIARKITESDAGHEVIAYDIDKNALKTAANYGIIPAHSKQEALAHLGEEDIAIVWLMLPSEITDTEILKWGEILPKNSIIINGGNSDFRKTQELGQKLQNLNLQFIDIGVSGGVWGYERGFPLMCGTDTPEAYTKIAPILDILATPGGKHALMGKSGAGHYVKMVHNAIEYGMMQSLAEGYHLLHDSPLGKHTIDIEAAASVWQHHSVIDSWLNDLAHDVVSENPNLDNIDGYVPENGEARWALEVAKEQGIAMPAIQSALDTRYKSQQGEVSYATKMLAALRSKFGGHNLNGDQKS